ncbi:MAG: exodeoxyribonuclease alpha chain [Chlamydiota bacterium]|jgi:exodeoxyribonuclease V alpha subunit
MLFPAEPIDTWILERVKCRFSHFSENQALLLQTLFALFRRGHLVLDMRELNEIASELEVEDRESFISSLTSGAQAAWFDNENIEWVVKEGPLLFLQKNAHIERKIAHHILRLHTSVPLLALELPSLDPRLSPEQKEAIEKVFSSSLVFIAGGPGTGKTFTAACLIEALNHASIIVAAPTGKAAFHLSQKLKSASIQTGTIHALLKKEVVCADLILIDESSMIDADLFAKLLEAIPSGCRVVFLGDPNQLPPVEAGSIFADLLKVPFLSSLTLSKTIRAETEQMLSLPSLVLEGKALQVKEALESASGWIDLSILSEEDFLRFLWKEYGERFFITVKDLQGDIFSLGKCVSPILSCMKKGRLGTEQINSWFYEKLLEKTEEDSYLLVPLLVTANHYDCSLYNGDQGVLAIKRGEDDVVFFSDDRKLPLQALKAFSFHYALSVHKSQGSEYEEVLIIANEGSEIFGKEVLYTAMTRARKRVRMATTYPLLEKTVARTSYKRSGIIQLFGSQRVNGT